MSWACPFLAVGYREYRPNHVRRNLIMKIQSASERKIAASLRWEGASWTRCQPRPWSQRWSSYPQGSVSRWRLSLNPLVICAAPKRRSLLETALIQSRKDCPLPKVEKRALCSVPHPINRKRPRPDNPPTPLQVFGCPRHPRRRWWRRGPPGKPRGIYNVLLFVLPHAVSASATAIHRGSLRGPTSTREVRCAGRHPHGIIYNLFSAHRTACMLHSHSY